MNPTNVLWTLLVFCCLVTVAQGDCNMRTLLSKVRRCYTDAGLNLNLPSGAQTAENVVKDIDAMSRDLSVICSNLDPYKNAMACALNEIRSCLGPHGNFLPDTNRAKAGMDYMCSKKDDFDIDCVQSETVVIQQCAVAIAQEWAKGQERQPGMQEIFCTAYDITYDCSKYALASCSGDTADVVLNSLNNYFLPAVCTGRPPARPRASFKVSGSSRLSALPLGALLAVVFLEISLFLRP